MVEHISNRLARFGVSPLLLAACLWISSVGSAQDRPISVGRNVQVSVRNGERQHWETQVAADPTHPERLVGCSIISPADRNRNAIDHNTVVYTSSDGGGSWRPTLELGPDLISRDPTCEFGPDGTAYFAAFAFSVSANSPEPWESETSIKNLFVYRSKDGGKTWLPPVTLPIIDRPFLAIDRSTGKYRGRVYVSGLGSAKRTDTNRRLTMPTLFYSMDGGMTFEDPTRMISDDIHPLIGSGNSVALSDGTLVWAFGDLKEYQASLFDDQRGIPENKPGHPNARLRVVTSDNGGKSFSDAASISDWYLRFYDRVNSMASVAVDVTKGPFRDRVYVGWSDARSGRAEILVSSSSDKGKTWSKPIAVNDDLPRDKPGDGPDDHMPALAVNSSGVVGVMWYDRRDNPDNLGWYTRFSASLDGGETFLSSVRVSEAPYFLDPRKPIALDQEADARGGGTHEIFMSAFAFMGGDTAGMAADARGVFHPLWIDNRTGVPQVWTAPVTVIGKGLKNGSADLQDLADITDKIDVDFRNTRYDPESRIVSAEVYLKNHSEQELTGPLKVRVLSLGSTVGPTEILNSDNVLTRSGAILDFSAMLQGTRLKPGETSKPKAIEMRITDPKLFYPIAATRYAISFASLRLKVLGKVQ
jgi:hypothetical protein